MTVDAHTCFVTELREIDLIRFVSLCACGIWPQVCFGWRRPAPTHDDATWAPCCPRGLGKHQCCKLGGVLLHAKPFVAVHCNSFSMQIALHDNSFLAICDICSFDNFSFACHRCVRRPCPAAAGGPARQTLHEPNTHHESSWLKNSSCTRQAIYL